MTKYNLSLRVLVLLLITIVNMVFIIIFNLIISLLYHYFNISIDYLLSLAMIALGVSLFSYYFTNGLSLNHKLIKDKYILEQQLSIALIKITKLQKEMQAEISNRQLIEKANIESENKLKTI